MAAHDERRDEAAEGVVRRNVAQARELLVERQREREQRAAEPPLEDDPDRAGQDTIPGQDNVPLGGTTGSQMNLGGGFRSGRTRQG